MKQHEAKQFLPLIQAWADGKTIQVKDCGGIWNDAEDLSFSGSLECYRIAPEPKLRAWKRGEQPIGKVVRHKQDQSQKSVLLAVSELDRTTVIIRGSKLDMENRILLEFYEMEDGSPCGVEE